MEKLHLALQMFTKLSPTGEMAVGLTYEDPALKLLNDGVDVKVIYPKEGTVFFTW